MTRYAWVAAQKADGFAITTACKVAQVSRQAFHDWRAQRTEGPTAAEIAETDLMAEIRDIHAEFDGTYGSPRMTPELRDRGFCVNHKRVERPLSAKSPDPPGAAPRSGLVGLGPPDRKSVV